MKINFKISNICILLSIILSINSISTTYISTDKSRLNYYKKISNLSNNTVSAKLLSPGNLGCIANEIIKEGELFLKIPKKYSLCPYYLFPFKYELVEILLEIPGMKESIGKEQRLSSYVEAYYLMYYLYAPKNEIKNYIQEKKLKHYYQIEEIDDSLKESFPSYFLNLDDEYFSLLKSLNFPYNMENEIKSVFDYLKQRIYTSPHMEMIFPWIGNYNKFKKAFYLITSRGVTIKYEDWKKLEEKEDKQNSEINKIIGQNTGSQCIISYLDLCNHYQPKYQDMRDKKSFILKTSHNNFLISSKSKFLPGQEVSSTYLSDSSNLMIFYRYGFVIYPNIFNLVKIRVEDENSFNINQFNLCKKLGCIESNIKDPMKVPTIREIGILYSKLEDSLINYGRVKYLNSKEILDGTKIISKKLTNEVLISRENEIQAWIFYFNICKKSLNKDNKIIENTIYQIQKLRNSLKKIEDKKEWNKIKIFENIYLMDLSYKIIIQRHIKGSLNHFILNTQKELDIIKLNYLN